MELLIYLAHDDVEGERLFSWSVDDEAFRHGAPEVGQEVGIAIH
jgi:hypothetical protein